jgi:hypothetical protein
MPKKAVEFTSFLVCLIPEELERISIKSST